jgi:hypothetical protein
MGMIFDRALFFPENDFVRQNPAQALKPLDS